MKVVTFKQQVMCDVPSWYVEDVVCITPLLDGMVRIEADKGEFIVPKEMIVCIFESEPC